MSPERIAEFRRKLREGAAARVVDGKIEIPGFPAATPGAPPVAATPYPPGYVPVAYVPAPASGPAGVHVKAHTWGGA